MKNILTFLFLSISVISFSQTTDCNGVVNGTSVLDSCGVCHSAYIYNFITHIPIFVANSNLLIPGVDYDPAQEIVVQPGDPGDPYWNASCTGCTDSIAINYNPLATVDDSSCYCDSIILNIQDCDSFTIGNATYYTSGIHTTTYPNISGCDSIVTINLSLSQSFIFPIAISACDSYTTACGTIFDTTAVYTFHYVNSYGCDSIVNYDVFIEHSTYSYDTLNTNSSIVWNGNTLSVSGNYSAILVNSVGCDSIAYLNLTIANTTGVSEIINKKNNLFMITDILGKETPYRRSIPLFYFYDDGTIERKVILE